MSASGILPLTDESIQIMGQHCTAFSNAAKAKFGCTAVARNMERYMDFPAASTSGRNKEADIRYTKQLSGGMKISVWKDDLTTHKVDAVVNAANEQLNHGGGLALALSRAGGPEIQQMSDHFIQTNKRVHTGDAIVTTAGKLPCKMIIHAVGPSVPYNPSAKDVSNAKPFLESVIWKIITLAQYNNLQSVAIPAISSGLYNFPRDICADIIVNTVKSASDTQHPQSTSLEVRLVNNDDPSVREMLRACQQILGPSATQSGAIQSQSVSSATSSQPILELGNVTLCLKKGEIQDETTDVIVNPIGGDLNLSKGFVSRAILNRAGKEIQNEVIKHLSKIHNNGDVIETKGHNLKSRAVYHAICNVQQSNTQILNKVITQCLKMTEWHGFSSISFPAIGTGNLGFSKEEVSQKMIGAVAEFAKKYNGKKKNVFFVIYPADTDKFEAFKKEMASAMKKTSKVSSNTNKTMYNHEIGPGTTPYIEFFTDSSEALREAKAWAVKVLHKQSSEVTMQNNHVIQFGQKEHEILMSYQTAFNVSIKEVFSDGKCGIFINGNSTGVSCAELEVEAMLCKAQEEFAQAEENDLLHSVVCWKGFPGSDKPEINAAVEKSYLEDNTDIDLTVSGQKVKIDFRRMRVDTQTGGGLIDRISFFSLYDELPKLKSKSYYQRSTINEKSYTSKEDGMKRTFSKNGLDIVKLEKIENNALKQVFELNKRRISAQPKQLFQCVKAQYCELISRVGFQRDYAPPEEQTYGAGIYFTNEPRRALKLWQDREEQYIYIIEAQVVTGRCTSQGSPQMIVPPSTADTQAQYDSVCNEARDTFVIFNGQQALPEYIYTCTINKH
ncbi:protein mono-ADP-ribosyltransferase PARP9 [Astyanax mexicanus]|uniref:protein mono-ADP-ribosyltransferase PARP9 n=1 Tax=Astyanax mexicanus TaxID=7994 RepID=UPI0020CAF3CF|nr:protein mono-ADP-ribosyltransferase PARP9 [Astyanax mexicanus]